MPVEDSEGAEDAQRRLTAPRPGHADLAGSQKFNFHDARYILERASARETAARVAAGALAKSLLREFGITILSHTIAVGHARLERDGDVGRNRGDLRKSGIAAALRRSRDRSTDESGSGSRAARRRFGRRNFRGGRARSSAGLGSHAQWDEKLDAQLAQAVMSIQAVKAVEIGTGIGNSGSYGSEVQDEIRYDATQKRFDRSSNRAGGLEGGITNGQDVVVRGYLKPISTLRRALLTADMNTKEAVKAAYERSDVCVVPAGGVVGEAMVALTLTGAFLEKFGGDSLEETRRNFDGYQRQLDNF